MPTTLRRTVSPTAASPLLLCLLLLCLAACGGGSDEDSTQSKGSGTDKTTESAGLTFEALEDLVAAKVPADSTCAAHKWTDPNPTLAPIFVDATTSQELGCWASADDVSASFPAEVLYAEFDDEATATSWITENFGFSYDAVQDGATVVLVSIVALPDLAQDIAGLCDCEVQEGKTP